jgi:DNA repair protein RadD
MEKEARGAVAMSELVARPYQLELVDSVWTELFTESVALAQLPTGGGKTFCFSLLIKKALEIPGVRVGVVMGRVDLVKQTERAIARVIPRKDIGIYCGSMNRKEVRRPVTIASIQSIRDIKDLFFNLLIIDEAHNFDQNKGGYLEFIDSARLTNPKVKIVGWTATPFRSDGRIYGKGSFFPRLCYQKTIQDMIALGFLCRPILKQGDNSFDTSLLRVRAGEYRQEDVDKLVSDESTLELQVKDALEKMKGRTCVAWATANIDHCNRVLDELQARGEYATSVHSKQNKETRNTNLSAFMGGGPRHMVFVSILSEGFDHPPIDCVVLMRPTRSPVLYIQTVGRGLRIANEKNNCLVLDYGQVVRLLGPLDEPNIKGSKREVDSSKGEAVLKLCDTCQTWVPGGCKECPECSAPFPILPPEEKLDRAPEVEAKILSEKTKPVTEHLGPAYIGMHESKSGNQCIRITYRDGNMLSRWGGYFGTSEYFVVTSTWAMERLERRLTDIDADLPGIPFDEEIKVPGTFEVTKTKDGKYDRIISVKKVSSSAPQPDQLDFTEDDIPF